MVLAGLFLNAPVGATSLTSVAPSRAFSGTCSVPSPSPARLAECDALALAAIDQARAREGVGPLGLPSGFDREGLAAQMLTLVNEERVDRGLAPVKGVSSALDRFALAGARSGLDPGFPSPFPGSKGGSVWTSVWSPLLADYLFMYDDGPGGVNLDCVSAHTAGCWGHRRILLGRYSGPLLLGVGATGRGGGVSGLAIEMVGGDRHDRADVVTWSSLRRTLVPGVVPRVLTLTPATASGVVTVAASGEPMSIRFTTSSPQWTVSPTTCTLRAGRECTVTVVGSVRTSSATLEVTGPGGSSAVLLRRS